MENGTETENKHDCMCGLVVLCFGHRILTMEKMVQSILAEDGKMGY
jgi:hypothetical protein